MVTYIICIMNFDNFIRNFGNIDENLSSIAVDLHFSTVRYLSLEWYFLPRVYGILLVHSENKFWGVE